MLRTLLLAGAAALSLASAQAKTLVYCSEGSPENFNPQLNTTGTTFDATHPVYGRLVEFKPSSVEIEPGLAERWDVSPDGKTFTFHLRRGVKWQSNAAFKPTRDFNADDVLFTFNRMARDDLPAQAAAEFGRVIQPDGQPRPLVIRVKCVEAHLAKQPTVMLDHPGVRMARDLLDPLRRPGFRHGRPPRWTRAKHVHDTGIVAQGQPPRCVSRLRRAQCHRCPNQDGCSCHVTAPASLSA